MAFLKHPLRHIPRKLLLIWDGLPAYRGQAVKDLLRVGAARRLHLEHLPGYAPDLYPMEGFGQYLKHVEMKNRCCRTLLLLHNDLHKSIGRLPTKPR